MHSPWTHEWRKWRVAFKCFAPSEVFANEFNTHSNRFQAFTRAPVIFQENSSSCVVGKNIFRGLFLSRPWYYGYKILYTSVFDGKYIQFIYQRRRNMLPFGMIMNFKFNPPIKNSSLVFFERMGNIRNPFKQSWLYRWIIPEFSGRWMNLILFTKATNLE